MKKSILFYIDQKHRDLQPLSLIGYFLDPLVIRLDIKSFGVGKLQTILML